jgi:hypothetical protein
MWNAHLTDSTLPDFISLVLNVVVSVIHINVPELASPYQARAEENTTRSCEYHSSGDITAIDCPSDDDQISHTNEIAESQGIVGGCARVSENKV